MAALAAGALTQVSVAATTDSLTSAIATGGTAPYTYQWYRSVTSAFTPGTSNIISGATALALNDSGLIPSTQYYYKVIATDAGSNTATSTQLGVTTTQAVQNISALTQSPQLGMLDLRFNTETIECQFDSTLGTGTLIPGQAVKQTATNGGIPKVIACTASTDTCFGFVVYDIKEASYSPGDRVTIASAGNVIYLYSSNAGAITRGAQVCLDVTSPGGVQATGASAEVVGFAIDGAASAGVLMRVKLKTPSFATA